MGRVLTNKRSHVKAKVGAHVLNPYPITKDFTGGSLPSNVSLTRGSTATYVHHSTGLVTSAAVNEARFESVNSQTGILIEKAATNLCLHSEDLSNAVYQTPNVTITANETTAPDGATTADGTDTITSTSDYIYQGSITVAASTEYTFSFWAKRKSGSGTTPRLAVYDESNAAFIDAAVNYTVNGSTWTRIDHTFTTPVGCTQLRVYPVRDRDTTDLALYLWGLQLEAGGYETSYIPTTTGAVARSADRCQVTDVGSWFNADEGSYFVEMVHPNPAFNTPVFLAFSDGGAFTNSMYVSSSSVPNVNFANVIVGGAGQAFTGFFNPTVGDTFKGAVRYGTDDFHAAMDGTLGSADVSGSVPTGIDTLYLGTNWAGTGNISDTHIFKFKYWNTKLTNAELQSETT